MPEMNHTSRMRQLLTAVRRERNGEVAESMRYYGRKYGLNYGVTRSTLRALVRNEVADHDFARFLYVQQVRELQMAALWLADPARLTPSEEPFWAEGITTSELAEEAAFALLACTPHFPDIFTAWTTPSASLLLQYAALLGAARREDLTTEWLGRVEAVVRRNPDDRLTAAGAVALLAALAQNRENRDTVLRIIGSLGASPSADFIHEEIAWRLEV